MRLAGGVADPATALRLVLRTRVLTLSSTPSPHRGAGGLKTLRDTAAPLGFSELVARRRGPSIEDGLVFGGFLENLPAICFPEFQTTPIFRKTAVTSKAKINPRRRPRQKGPIFRTFRFPST